MLHQQHTQKIAVPHSTNDRTQLDVIRGKFQKLSQALRQVSVFDASLLLTLCVLIRFAGSDWFVEVPLTTLVVIAIVYRPLIHNQNFWFLVASFLVAGSYYNWFIIDNHKYLLMYWAIAIYCSLGAKNAQGILAKNAQLLIGLCFAFAVVWKIVSPDYLDGTFFEYKLLFDGRFANAAESLAGVSDESRYLHTVDKRNLIAFDSTETGFSVSKTPRVALIAQALTWWTIGIELLLAIAFLIPYTERRFHLRTSLLVVFMLTTYTNAPVIGFGWLLGAMGVAQCPEDKRSHMFAVMAAFMIIWIYGLPIASFVDGAFGVAIPMTK